MSMTHLCRAPVPKVAGLSLLLATGSMLLPAASQAQTTEDIRREMEQLRQQYIALEQRLEEVEAAAEDNTDALDEVFSPEFMTEGMPPSVTQNFEFHGYIRSGFIFNERGASVLNANEELIHPDGLFEIGWRLGNEADTYGEATLVYNWPVAPDGAQFKFVGTLAYKYQGDKSNYIEDTDEGNDLLFREAYVRAENVLPNNPGVAFWAGQRFYDRHDIHINDFYFLDMSGYGGGVENIALPTGNLWVAYLGGSQDDAIIPQRGPATEHHLDIRWKDIPLLGGNGMVWLDLSYLFGEATTLEDENDWGWALGFVHSLTLPSGDMIQGGFNKWSVQYGNGPSSDFNAYVLDWRDMNFIDDSETFRFTNQTVLQFSDRFSMMAALVADWSELGEGYFGRDEMGELIPSDRLYLSLGARPVYMLTDHVALQAEAGVDWVDDIRWTGDVEDEGILYKFTIAPTIRPGGSFFARPEIRVFATYSFWDDMPEWFTPGGLDFPAPRDNVWFFGVQTEAWW